MSAMSGRSSMERPRRKRFSRLHRNLKCFSGIGRLVTFEVVDQYGRSSQDVLIQRPLQGTGISRSQCLQNLAVFQPLLRHPIDPTIARIVDPGDLHVRIEAAVDLDQRFVARQFYQPQVELAIALFVLLPVFLRPLQMAERLLKPVKIGVGDVLRHGLGGQAFQRAAYGEGLFHVFRREKRDIGTTAGSQFDKSLNHQPGNRVFDRGQADVQLFGQHFDVQSLAWEEGLVEDALAKNVENAVAGALPFYLGQFHSTRLTADLAGMGPAETIIHRKPRNGIENKIFQT